MSRYRQTMAEALRQVRESNPMGYTVKFANSKGAKIATAWYKDEADAKKALEMIKKNGGNGIISKGRMDEETIVEGDHEISMARGELEAISDKALQLASILKNKTDDDNLEAWVQSKITKAKDYINSVNDYMTYNPEQKQNEELEEGDAYDNNRYMMKKYMGQVLARLDNGNTKDTKDHVYAPNAEIAKQLYKQGKKVYREELEEAKIVSDISGVSINKLKQEVMPFNVKVGKVGPGMDSDYEVEFTGSEPNLIKYAKKHLDFDGNNFSQLKKHLAMEETEVNEKTYGWTLVSKAKDLAKKYANNMTKAVAEIEKLEKGLSDNPTVYRELLKYNEEVELDEKISDIFKANKEGESVEDIAKKLKLSPSMVKKLLGEATEDDTETDPDKIALAKERDTDVLEKQLKAAQGQINVLKQKIENEKNKAVKPMPNPETGEVPLTIGIAHKILRDNQKKEADEKKQKEISKQISSMAKGEEETKLESFTKKYLSHLNESEASDKAKAMGLDYMSFGRYGKDGKVTHKSVGGNLKALSKKDQEKDTDVKPTKPKTKTTGSIKNPDDTKTTTGQIKKEILQKIEDEDLTDPEMLVQFDSELTNLADDLQQTGDRETANKVLDALMAAEEEDTDTPALIDDMMNALKGKPDINSAKKKELSQMTSLYTDATYSDENVKDFVNDTTSIIKKMGEVAEAGSMDSDAYGPGIRSDAMVELVSTCSNIQDKIEDMDINDDIKRLVVDALETISDRDTDEFSEEGEVVMSIENLKYQFKRLAKENKAERKIKPLSKSGPSSKVTSDVVDVEPKELKKQAKKYGLTVKIGSGDPEDGYEVEFKGPKKNILKYYKKYMGYDGDDFEGLSGLGNIGENKILVKEENLQELEEVTQKEIDKFHTDLDSLVHKTFGHSSKEKEKMDEKVASSIIKDLQKAYAPMKGKTISPEMANKISKHLDQPSYDLNVLRQLKKADIPFISTIARNKIYKKTGRFEDRRLYVEAIAGLQKKADKSGMPYNILKQVYDRGMAAWKSGHRPGASQQQWAFARVNSFITKSSGTWGGADKDLAAKVKGSK